MLTVSLMQPYLFPYMGYFDLLTFSDTFVFYDDAAYSKNSWYNRNRIAGIAEPWDYLGVAVRKAPLGTPTSEILLAQKSKDFQTVLRQLERYSKAPHYRAVRELVCCVFEASGETLASLAMASVLACAKHIGLECQILRSSEINYDRTGKALEKILGICKAQNAHAYLNLSGGRALYHPEDFSADGLALHFCRPEPVTYETAERQFEANLSVLDGLMWMSPEQVRRKLMERTPIDAADTSVDLSGR